MGLLVTAAPFRQRVHRHVEQPPLTAGIAVDVSGSMGWAADTLSSVAWVIAQAAHRVGGRSATVAFGAAVTPIIAPGRPPSRVTGLAAHDGWEAFVEATRALDGALALATDVGARVLVVVTDGHLVGPGQLPEGARLVRRLTGAGVRVVHLSLSGTRTRPLAGATLAELGGAGDALDVIVDVVVAALTEPGETPG